MNSDCFDILEVLTSIEEICEEVAEENDGEVIPKMVGVKLFQKIKEYCPYLTEEVETIESIWESSNHENLMHLMPYDEDEMFLNEDEEIDKYLMGEPVTNSSDKNKPN